MKRLAILVPLFLLSAVMLSGQPDSVSDKVSSLKSLYQVILELDPFGREKAAETFEDSLFVFLSRQDDLQTSLDALEKLGNIYSTDGKLRIITWNIPVGLDEQRYYGIVQYYPEKQAKPKTIKLTDPLGSHQLRKIEHWPGALYYSLIETRHAGQDYYTLLGFDFNNALSNKKVVDVLSVDEYGELYFCEKLIEYQNQLIDRLEFEYNEKAVMSLRYDERLKMIVFDHLSPSKPSLEGQHEFYGPDFTYDALKFEKGKWVHYEGIEITN